jgi:hypothetical protein
MRFDGVELGPRHIHIEALIPVRIQRLLDHASGACLLAIHRCNGERVRESCVVCQRGSCEGCLARAYTEDIAFVEAISSNDCSLLALQFAPCRGHCRLTYW